MGQLYVASVQLDHLPDVIVAMGQAGFEVARDGESRQYRCRRGDREVVLEVSSNEQESHEAFIVLAHPPYSLWPWRWYDDCRYFNAITDVLATFKFRA